MIRTYAHPLLGVLLLAACSGPQEETSTGTPSTVGTTKDTFIASAEPQDVPIVDDNVFNDTLYVEVTFDLKDGTHMMVARSQRETFEGLQLMHYKARPDSSAEVIAISTPAYDSWTMLPTFFLPDQREDMVLLVNFGERQSWGQKVIGFGKEGFTDIGFMDVAVPVTTEEDEERAYRLENAGPLARVTGNAKDLRITFATDSLFLYDDLRGGTELILPASRVEYRIRSGRVFLAIDGKEVEVVRPA